MTSTSHEMTRLLLAWRNGDREALDRLMPMAYQELHQRARGMMKGEKAGHSLQPTLLVNELFLRLVKSGAIDPTDRRHFVNLCCRIMRHILIDHFRAAKPPHESLLEDMLIARLPDVDYFDLERALDELAVLFPRRAEIVEMKYILQMEIREIAELFDLKPHNVMDEWRAARGWLRKRLTDAPKNERNKGTGN
jgi:RNA polymerase sigma-70 factor, ECF subfamily